MEIVVEGGMEEDVEQDQRVLGEREQSVHTGLTVAIVAVEKVHGEQERSHGSDAAQHLVLEGQLTLSRGNIFKSGIDYQIPKEEYFLENNFIFTSKSSPHYNL